MKIVFYTIILVFFFFLSNSQACLKTNQISLNTGVDPITNSVLPLGTNDPRWIIDNANNIPGAVNNSPAVLCYPNGGAASNPNSAWIGFATTSSYVTNNPTVGYYLITFRMPFRTCDNDSLFFNFNIANDNYISDMRIDGVATGFSQPVSLATSNWTGFTIFNYNGFYLSGNHFIEIDVQNYNVANAVNPHMLNVYGNINSLSNSIVSYSSPANCICNPINIDSIIANFSTSITNKCDSTIIQFIDLSTAVNSTVVSWLWDFGDGNTSVLQNPVHDYLNAGTYNVSLIVTSSTNKTDTFTMTIHVSANQTLNVQANAFPKSICIGDSTTLTASGANTYTWSGGVINGLPFSPTTTTTYTVTGVDANGCSNTSSVTVYVNDDGKPIFIPSAFSPNGDGANDCFRVKTTANFKSYYLAIYNRWGELVFESDDPTLCWDGYHKSEKALIGTYYYFLKAETNCGKVFKKGDITLIR